MPGIDSLGIRDLFVWSELVYSPGCGPELVEILRMYEVMGEILGKKAIVRELSAQKLLEEEPEEEMYMRNRYCSSAALEAAGIRLPGMALREGLSRTLAGI